MRSVKLGAVALCAAVVGLIAPPADAALLVGSAWPHGVLYDIDPATGAASNPRSTHLDRLVGIAFAGDGLIYGLSGGRAKELYRIDPVTGDSQLVGKTDLPTVFEGDLDFDPVSGALYTVQTTPGLRGARRRELFAIDVGTGQTELVGSVAGVGDLSAMAFDPQGMLYMLDSARDLLLTVDAATAAVQSSVTLSVGLGSVAGMDFDPVSGLLYVTDGQRHGTDSLYTLDPDSGALEVIGATGQRKGFAGLQFVPEPVEEPEIEPSGSSPAAGGSVSSPEPGTLALLAAGGVGLFRRRRL